MSFTAPNDFHRIGHGEKKTFKSEQELYDFFSGTSIAQDLLSKDYRARWIPFPRIKKIVGMMTREWDPSEGGKKLLVVNLQKQELAATYKVI